MVLRFSFADVALCAFGLLAASSAFSETYALLVGVSGYPSLPEARRLRGPANDVQLMQEALQRSGVPSSAIRVLADGVPQSAALPTRTEILGSLQSLSRQAKRDDWVILYFSGHGSQQPQPPGFHAYIEPEGLDEIFLPYDIGRWDGGKMVVENAIVDDEFGEALDAFALRGAHVWAIFDTCHAGDMAKGVAFGPDAPVTRYVSPGTLGVPDRAMAQARQRMAGAKAAMVDVKAASANAPVVFYASQPEEPAAEEPLADPFGSPAAGGAVPSKRYFGVFTYLIAQALPDRRGTFRQLSLRVAERYKSRPYPTPLFEGDLERRLPFASSLTPTK